MKARVLILVTFLFSYFFTSSAWADDGYVGEDLWNDIYKRLDEGTYKLKKQLIENRLKGSAARINTWVGNVCSTKDGASVPCFIAWSDFTASEFDEISGGGYGPIYAHMNPSNTGLDTNQIARIQGIIVEHYQDLVSQVTSEQKKLQSVWSIGLFTDGNKDNSSYDLMVDLENIHAVLFAKDIPYMGTDNMGASSVANMLANAYNHPFLPLNPLENLTMTPENDPGVKMVNPSTGSGLTLSGILNASGCISLDQVPGNLDPDFLRDVQSQLIIGVNPDSSLAFSDNGRLPEAWAKLAKGAGWSAGWAGGGSDTFPCSWKDFFCILVTMTNYTQNLLGWAGSSIEAILDANLKIANKYAVSSFVQSKMTRNFFQLSLKNLDLPSMAHIGTVVTRLPPPLLNFKPGTTGGDTGGFNSTGEADEFNQILVGTFEEMWLDFKRQNSLEQNNQSRMVNNLTHLTTNSVVPKSDTNVTPKKGWYIQAKEMEIKKSYGDSFNDDLFELHDFTVAFSKSLETVTSVIKLMNAIPQK